MKPLAAVNTVKNNDDDDVTDNVFMALLLYDG